MINDINVEHTRIALQKKYGDPNSFVYDKAQPLYLSWNSNASFGTQPDYLYVSSAKAPFTCFVGVLTIITGLEFIGVVTHNIVDASGITNQWRTNITAASATAVNSTNAAFQQYVNFNTFQLLRSGSPVNTYNFFGYLFMQP
jgi:hypothetical protein